jgi:enoyl-CoA hydratase/carnithine racemase
MPEHILVQQREQIFEIILNRPDKRNAMNWAMLDEIRAALDDAERAFNTGDARVMFIRAEGRAFSAGIDLEGFINNSNPYGDNWRDNLFPTTAGLQDVMNRIENHTLPTICIMHGYCLGLGLEMALACDFRIAAERTKLSLPESRLGMIPDVGGTTRLVKLVGPARAKELIMTGRNFDTDLAERWGILNYVVTKDDLMAKAEELAQELILAAPLAVSYTKRVINDMMENARDLQIEAWAQAQLLRTRDFENGVKAMLTKTYPVEWEGK